MENRQLPFQETAPPTSRSGTGWRTWLKTRIKHPQRWGYGLAGLAGALLLAWLLQPAPIAVDLGTVERGPLQVTLAAEAKTRVRDRYVVSAPVAGRLARVTLAVGDRVQAGELIAQIDPLPYTSEVASAQARLRQFQAELAGVDTQRPKASTLDQARARISAAAATEQATRAQVAQAQAALEQATRERVRSQALAAAGAISQQQLESTTLAETTQRREWEAAQDQLTAAMAEVKAAEEALQTLQAEQQDPDYLQNVYRAQIAGAQAELANLADQAQRTDISAPAAGQVLQLNQQSARYVQAGDPLVEVGNPGASELVIDVLSTDAEQVQPGDPVKRAGADPPVATVRLVEPSAFTKVSALGVEEQRVNVIADWLTLPTGLGDGYRVDTEIVIWSAEAVVKVPVSALFRCQQAWCVFVDQHGRAAQQAVQVNQRNAFEAVVEAGLQVGDRVVLYPPDNLSDRQRISER